MPENGNQCMQTAFWGAEKGVGEITLPPFRFIEFALLFGAAAPVHVLYVFA